MATINFNICKSQDCTGFTVTETTGLQPVDANGYGDVEDISAYTSTLTFSDADNAVVATFHPTPNSNRTAITYDWIQSDEAVSSILDAWYKVKYEVFNGSGVTQGYKEGVFIKDCTFLCDMEDALADLAEECKACKGKLSAVIDAARVYYAHGKAMANINKLPNARKFFDLAKREIAKRCKCN